MFNNPISSLNIRQKIRNNAYNQLKKFTLTQKPPFNSSMTTTLETTIVSYSNYPQT